MNPMSDFHIVFDSPSSGRVWMDGKPLKCVRAVKVEGAADEAATVTVMFFAKSINVGTPPESDRSDG